MVPPILSCFNHPDSRVRYYACESMYNISKIARGEMLRYFNGLFDALSNVRRYLFILDHMVVDHSFFIVGHRH
jgi:hypothetical protein